MALDFIDELSIESITDKPFADDVAVKLATHVKCPKKQLIMKDVNEVVRTLIKNGAKQINGAVIKTVSVNRKESYDSVCLTLTKPIKGYVRDGDSDAFVEGETKVIFASSFSLGAILANSEDTAFAKKKLLAKPKLLELVLSYAKIDILQEKVNANTDYINPFSENEEGRTIDHDTYINHIISIELGKRGKLAIEKLFDKLFDSEFEDFNEDEEV